MGNVLWTETTCEICGEVGRRIGQHDDLPKRWRTAIICPNHKVFEKKKVRGKDKNPHSRVRQGQGTASSALIEGSYTIESYANELPHIQTVAHEANNPKSQRARKERIDIGRILLKGDADNLSPLQKQRIKALVGKAAEQAGKKKVKGDPIGNAARASVPEETTPEQAGKKKVKHEHPKCVGCEDYLKEACELELTAELDCWSERSKKV